jgi:regulator of sigma E protease
MILTILIVFFSLILLIILHELGHFLVARKFGVKVEEFGVFLPPRLWGKKIGETIYSINLIPLGAFVRVQGEEGEEAGLHDIRSFSSKPIWQRVLIVVGGVVAFWAVAAVLFSVVMWLGAPSAVADDEQALNAKVQIAAVAADSPAQEAGLRIGDSIKELRTTNYELRTDKVKETQEFIEQHKGEQIILTVERGKRVFEVALIPRVSPPEGEGAMGVALARTAEKSYPWYEASLKGVEKTIRMTGAIVAGLTELLGNLITGRGTPPGAQLMGPVGIGAMLVDFAQLGTVQYLHFIAVISIYLAIFNILPIPALDGGKLLFLGMEKIKGRPVSRKVEQNITAFFFSALLLMIVLVTIRDIARLL